MGKKEKPAVLLKDLIPPEHLHTLFSVFKFFFLIIAFFFKRNFLGEGSDYKLVDPKGEGGFMNWFMEKT